MISNGGKIKNARNCKKREIEVNSKQIQIYGSVIQITFQFKQWVDF